MPLSREPNHSTDRILCLRLRATVHRTHRTLQKRRQFLAGTPRFEGRWGRTKAVGSLGCHTAVHLREGGKRFAHGGSRLSPLKEGGTGWERVQYKEASLKPRMTTSPPKRPGRFVFFQKNSPHDTYPKMISASGDPFEPCMLGHVRTTAPPGPPNLRRRPVRSPSAHRGSPSHEP